MNIKASDHAIAIEPFRGTVTVTVHNVEVARSDQALALSEGNYPTVYYLPQEDVTMGDFFRSDKVTHCPHKGDAAHFTVRTSGGEAENAAWSYEKPLDGVAEIAGHIAFYAGKAEVIAEPA